MMKGGPNITEHVFEAVDICCFKLTLFKILKVAAY